MTIADSRVVGAWPAALHAMLQLMMEFELRFKSGNSVQVERAHITATEFAVICNYMQEDEAVSTDIGMSNYRLQQERDALQSRLDAVGRLADSLVGQADDAYVRYIGALNTDECKGQQFKLHNGKFGEAELEAHKKAASLFAKHRELMAAANAIRSAALGGATTGEGGQ